MNFSLLVDYVRTNITLLVMIALVFVSAVSVIYLKHIGRTEFVSLQKLERHRDDLNEEWGRLLLEQSTWATPSRIEQQAHTRIGMVVPSDDMVVVIKP